MPVDQGAIYCEPIAAVRAISIRRAGSVVIEPLTDPSKLTITGGIRARKDAGLVGDIHVRPIAVARPAEALLVQMNQLG